MRSLTSVLEVDGRISDRCGLSDARTTPEPVTSNVLAPQRPAEARLWPTGTGDAIRLPVSQASALGQTEYQHDKGVLSSHVDLRNPASTGRERHRRNCQPVAQAGGRHCRSG